MKHHTDYTVDDFERTHTLMRLRSLLTSSVTPYHQPTAPVKMEAYAAKIMPGSVFRLYVCEAGEESDDKEKNQRIGKVSRKPVTTSLQ